jgi:hypothetical protein
VHVRQRPPVLGTALVIETTGLDRPHLIFQEAEQVQPAGEGDHLATPRGELAGQLPIGPGFEMDQDLCHGRLPGWVPPMVAVCRVRGGGRTGGRP